MTDDNKFFWIIFGIVFICCICPVLIPIILIFLFFAGAFGKN